jgi:hypothetical protein
LGYSQYKNKDFPFESNFEMPENILKLLPFVVLEEEENSGANPVKVVHRQQRAHAKRPDILFQ